MRKITEIIIHCSATIEGKDYTVADIDRWHRARGFKKIGYHYIVRLNGTIEKGRPLDMIGAHCIGHNRNSIGICYIGGLDSRGKPKDTRTTRQKAELTNLVNKLQEQFPGIRIHGHSEFSNKVCPCFNVSSEF